MPRQKLDRIEIYLSPDSPDDLMLLEIWKTLSSSGRGRGQSFFRHALLRGIRTMKYPDTPDIVSGLINKDYPVSKKKRGPKRTWKPSQKQKADIDEVIIQNKDKENTSPIEKPDIPIEIITDYEQEMKEQEPTAETLGFADEKTDENKDIINSKKKSRLGNLM